MAGETPAVVYGEKKYLKSKPGIGIS